MKDPGAIDRNLKAEASRCRELAKVIYNQLCSMPSGTAYLQQCDAVLLFMVELPFQLRTPPGGVFTFELQGGSAVSLHFDSYDRPVYVVFGSVPSVPMTLIRLLTPVSTGDLSDVLDLPPTTAGHLANVPSSEHLSGLFDRCLESLNEFLHAYMVRTGDSDVHPLTLEMFPFGSLWFLFDSQTFEEMNSGLFVTSYDVPYAKAPLTTSDVWEIAGFISNARASPNPFTLVAQLFLAAQRQRRSGQHALAAVLQATSVEVFLNVLLEHLLLLEGKGEQQIAEVFDIKRDLLGRVKSQYHGRIGGIFAIDRPGPLRNWYENVWLLRNKVVHRGYQPSRNETLDSISAAEELVRYVWGLLRKKPSKFGHILRYGFLPEETRQRA